MATKTLTKSKLAKLRGARWSEADAREVLDAIEDSGRTIHAFAHEHDLKAHKLYWWRERLAYEPESREDIERLTFAPVTVTGLGRAPVVVVRLGELEVEVIEPRDVDPAWLARVLAAAKGAP